jgi:hypothetical protein
VTFVIGDVNRPNTSRIRLKQAALDEGGNHEKAGSAFFSNALALKIDERHMGPEDGSIIYKHLRETGRELRRSYYFKSKNESEVSD